MHERTVSEIRRRAQKDGAAAHLMLMEKCPLYRDGLRAWATRLRFAKGSTSPSVELNRIKAYRVKNGWSDLLPEGHVSGLGTLPLEGEDLERIRPKAVPAAIDIDYGRRVILVTLREKGGVTNEVEIRLVAGSG